MIRTTIKPVPGYGDVLSDLNQVPVLTLADRVRRDIVLPVLGGSDESRFMGSANGSLLNHRTPIVLADLESELLTITIGAAQSYWKPAQRGWWFSVDFLTGMTIV